MGAAASLHEAVAGRLATTEQRYTAPRRRLVDALAAAGRPLTIPEIIGLAPDMPQSSAYRNITVLTDAGVVRRVAGTDDHGRFELDEHLSGHHHHLVCATCGRVDDVTPSPRLERALEDTAGAVAAELGYVVKEHRLDLLGLCPDCQRAS